MINSASDIIRQVLSLEDIFVANQSSDGRTDKWCEYNLVMATGQEDQFQVV